MGDIDVNMLHEYDNWKAEKRFTAEDYSPEAFLLDRAKSVAIEKLIAIDELVSDEIPNVPLQFSGGRIEDANELIAHIWRVIHDDD